MFSFTPANVATDPLDAVRSLLGDIESNGFVLHDEEIEATLATSSGRPGLLQLARQMRTRLGMRASSIGAGPFKKAYDNRLKALDLLIGDLENAPLPPIFGGDSAGLTNAAVGELTAPDLSDFITD